MKYSSGFTSLMQQNSRTWCAVLTRSYVWQGMLAIILQCAVLTGPLSLVLAAQQPHTPPKSGLPSDKPGQSPFHPAQPKSGYVGSRACSTCHGNIYRSFRQTSMGQSMLPGTESLSVAAVPSPATVFDKDTNQYFEVRRESGALYQSQYAVDSNGKTIFRQTWKLDYVIGAGVDGYGFLVQRGHYLFEAPLSYYTKTRSWGFSPGFEIRNRGFTRPILDRCITCHSGRPKSIPDKVGLYDDPPFDELAVGCENCHGPGGLHVMERTSDSINDADFPIGADASIVNPARLSGWRADNVCMRCHQGQDVRVNLPGHNAQDFRPSMLFGDVVDIFKIAPEPSAAPSALPLEHYFGMTLSKCYRASGSLHCVTCHDPHVESSAPQAVENYKSQCLRCHSERSCTGESAKRQATNPPDNCLICHMPKRSVTTIAHAALTDHSIPARPSPDLQPPDQNHRDQGTELLLLTAPPEGWKNLDSVSPAVLFQAYDSLVGEGRQQFEPLLDRLSTQVANAAPTDPVLLRALARAEFRKNTSMGNQKALEYMKRVLHLGHSNVDDDLFASTLFVRTGQIAESVKVLERARIESPYFREVYENLASDFMELGQYGDALTVIGKGIELFPEDEKLRELQRKAHGAILTVP